MPKRQVATRCSSTGINKSSATNQSKGETGESLREPSFPTSKLAPVYEDRVPLRRLDTVAANYPM